VTDFDDELQLYHVRYSDGDEEDLDHYELTSLLGPVGDGARAVVVPVGTTFTKVPFLPSLNSFSLP
jgi:hypothetical protein